MPPCKDLWFGFYVQNKGAVGIFCRTNTEAGLALFDEIEAAHGESGILWQRGQGKASADIRHTGLDWRSPADRPVILERLVEGFRRLAPVILPALERQRTLAPMPAVPDGSFV